MVNVVRKAMAVFRSGNKQRVLRRIHEDDYDRYYYHNQYHHPYYYYYYYYNYSS